MKKLILKLLGVNYTPKLCESMHAYLIGANEFLRWTEPIVHFAGYKTESLTEFVLRVDELLDQLEEARRS